MGNGEVGYCLHSGESPLGVLEWHSPSQAPLHGIQCEHKRLIFLVERQIYLGLGGSRKGILSVKKNGFYLLSLRRVYQCGTRMSVCLILWETIAELEEIL